MARPIYVIGHKNSDLDSVASAYAYARLLQLQGEEEAIAARNGELKPEVSFVLERFQVEPPEAIDDVTPGGMEAKAVETTGGCHPNFISKTSLSVRPGEFGI